MNAPTLVLRSAENNAWANHRLLTACAQLTEEERRATRTSFFPTIHGTLAHNATVDRYYLDAIEALPGPGLAIFTVEEPFASFDALVTAQRAADARLLAVCRAISDDTSLDRTVRIPRSHGVIEEQLGDVLLHLFEHQVHHRGQAHAMLAGTRVAPPQLDEWFLAVDASLRAADLASEPLRALGLPRR